MEKNKRDAGAIWKLPSVIYQPREIRPGVETPSVPVVDNKELTVQLQLYVSLNIDNGVISTIKHF